MVVIDTILSHSSSISLSAGPNTSQQLHEWFKPTCYNLIALVMMGSSGTFLIIYSTKGKADITYNHVHIVDPKCL